MLEDAFIQSKFSGTKIAYYIVCKRKLWLFAHNINFETYSDFVQIGKLISEEYFKREKHKEIMIGDTVKIDFVRLGDEIVVHEVKKSKKLEEAHIWQVKFYIYTLKKKGIKCNSGVIHYPKLLRKVDVKFTPEDEKMIHDILKEAEKVLEGEAPPPIKASYCTKCAYYQFCYI